MSSGNRPQVEHQISEPGIQSYESQDIDPYDLEKLAQLPSTPKHISDLDQAISSIKIKHNKDDLTFDGLYASKEQNSTNIYESRAEY